jgi:putative transposase
VHARPGTAIGVDLGVRTLLTGADNTGTIIVIGGPQALRASLRKLRRASRAHSRKASGSANRCKAAAKLARVHARAANVRADALHKATTALARGYQTIVCEDLHVAGMVGNRRLARAIADQGFGQARRMLADKTAWNGGQLIVADRWYPSSKTCSGCGAVKTKLALSERTYRCDHCGLALDRDVNAARNLAALAALISTTGTGVAGDLEPEGSNGRRADHKTGPAPAGGAEASTPHQATGQDGDRPPATASYE